MVTKRQITARKQHARVTIADVAHAAGVSPMTVSRVVNGDARVRATTRDAVNQAIETLGYSPNKAARSLATASQLQIGLLYDNPSSSFLSAMLLGVLDQARRCDTQVVVVECADREDGMRSVRNLIAAGIDGIILSPPLADSTEVLDLLRDSRTQCITIGTRRDEEHVSSVSIDNYAAAREMTDHLLTLGHRRIAFIKGSPDQLATEERLAGFRAALAAAGIDVADELVVDGRFSYRSGLKAAEKLLSMTDRPTAIFACNDDMAAATVATAHRNRIDIPGELTVCGFDDTLLATTIWPEITTIHQPITTMSQTAIDLLEKRIRALRDGRDPEQDDVTLEFRFVRRGSDAPPP